MRKILFSIAVGAALATLVVAVASAAASFKAKPWEFVGTVANCGVAGADTVAGTWVDGEGLPDAGKSSHALYLQKFGPTSNCAAGGAEIDGVEGLKLTELGFDYREDGHCGAGAPRFNVYTTAGTYYFFGCIYGAHTPVAGEPDWTRVRFGNADAFPADGVTPWPGFNNATMTGIDIVFDEGQDVGEGYIYLDNIDINGVLIGKPGNAE